MSRQTKSATFKEPQQDCGFWDSSQGANGAQAHLAAGNEIRTTHIILPAYNEEASLASLLKRFEASFQLCPRSAVIWVVNDGSTDRTAEIAGNWQERLDLRLQEHPRNMGLGQAVITGIIAALNAAAANDVLVVMDADDTHDVDLINAMVARIAAGADIAIASRFVAGGDDSTAPLFRRLLSRGAATVFRRALPLKDINDFTSGFRAYQADLLRRAVRHWGERLIEEQGFACMVELLLKLRYLNPAIEEVPLVLYYDRKQGRSKLKLMRTILQYLNLAVRDRLAPRPLRVI
jgi:dolichol-phosphate mannosyltransferase